MTGLACIELGCGTAYVSAWMCRRGANVVAIDPTPNQLEMARRLQKEHQLDFVIEEGIADLDAGTVWTSDEIRDKLGIPK